MLSALRGVGIALVIADLSNPHNLILSPLRLPIPPLRREADFNTATMAHSHFSHGLVPTLTMKKIMRLGYNATHNRVSMKRCASGRWSAADTRFTLFGCSFRTRNDDAE
jgi:hypothetical protein